MFPRAISGLVLALSFKLLAIGDKLRLSAICQAGVGDKSRGGFRRFERRDLRMPKSRLFGAVK